MTFNNERAIYLQLADRLCDEILAGVLAEEGRVPSVREYAALLQVNVNTAMKAYESLAREEIIFNRRGMGYFVSPGAKALIHQKRRRIFLEERVPEFVAEMRLLDISIADVREAIERSQA
ncbi:MAG: GntR family transcriptional regulator [Alloprevotella sp.]|nr:GntR family transcriptional regulator [Bacteroidales bacterium]MDY3943920.1 GntR family transcriptional regulator [Alloprevotella sp.]